MSSLMIIVYGEEKVNMTQLSLLNEKQGTKDTSSTFVDNLSLPIHRWFRFPAGFSAAWVREVINSEKQKRGEIKVVEPFAGAGTVLLEAEFCNVESMGIESHPFISRIASTKLKWRESIKDFSSFSGEVFKNAKSYNKKMSEYPQLVNKCYPNEILVKLDALLKSWESVADDSPPSELTWLAIVSILRECSPVGTASWQYVLPKKSKARVRDPFEAFDRKVQTMSKDMDHFQKNCNGPKAILHKEDSRDINISIPDKWANLIITSPPYANNFDYADSTRLEMSFLGDITKWGDLQDAVRKYLVRSCTQHVSSIRKDTYDILGDPLLDPIRDEITEVCQTLDKEKDTRAAKKPYHTMVVTYFLDLAKIWHSLRRVTSDDSLVCFVVGDSAPYGIYVPVDKWLGDLAIAAGFKSYSFEKTRDRNIKWKNRKHRVPLHEGRLWVKG